MLKIKSIFVSLLAVAALASCSNENDDITDGGEKRDYDVAYMSVSVEHVLPVHLVKQTHWPLKLRSRSFIWFCLMTKKRW